MTELSTQDEAKSVPLSIATCPIQLKKVYFVRHAESLQNESINAIRDGGIFFCCSLVSFLCNSWGLHDAELSPKGLEQVDDVRAQIGGPAFLEEAEIGIVAHSPMMRAKQTAFGLFGKDDGAAAGVKSTDVALQVDNTSAATGGSKQLDDRFICLDFCHEVDSCEFLTCTYGRARIKQLEDWIDDRKENNIVVVAQ